MKTITSTAIACIFVFLYAFAPYNGSETVTSTETTSEVYSIHDLEIKPGIDSKEFESFVLEQLVPIYNKMEGQNMILVKGDRGMRTGKYSILLTFSSIEDRNRIYPPSGELVGDFGDQAIWDMFESMVVDGLGKTHTDYVKVAH